MGELIILETRKLHAIHPIIIIFDKPDGGLLYTELAGLMISFAGLIGLNKKKDGEYLASETVDNLSSRSSE